MKFNETNLAYYVEPDMKKIGSKNNYRIFKQSSMPDTNVMALAHIHNAIELLYVNEGSFTTILGETEYYIEKGDLLLIRTGVIHRIFSGSEEKNSYYVIKIAPSLIFDFAVDSNASKYILNLKLGEGKKCKWTKAELEGTQLKAITESIINEHSKDDYCSDIAIKSGCAQILMHILRETEGDGSSQAVSEATDEVIRLIYKAIEHIYNNFQRKVTALECSKAVGMSYSYFSRTFKSVTGKTFSEFLEDIRLDNAKKLLLTTDKAVAEIAFESGYNDTCYFIAEFRKKSGLTPKQFRLKN
ncbi:MAG: helix-turn-helix transcriptional regulator [Clostridia bacterium]|nr:helix-turn-helix transcriptional regulator [Clostridia bacterium]